MNEKCFAMRRNNECSALAVKGCPGYGRCPFYKPRWMAQRDQDRVDVKLRALPPERQTLIAEKYHNGNMPWRGEHE